MKFFFLLSLISTSLFAQSEKGLCRFDLVGPTTLPDAVMETIPMTHEECKEAAIKILKENREYYDKALVRNFKTGQASSVKLKD